MSGQQIIFGLLEFLVSVLISFILIFGSYRIILVLTRRIDEEKQLKKKNISVGIVLGSVFIGEALVVKQALYPVMAVIQLFILGQEKDAGNFTEVLLYSFGYVFLAGLLAILCILFSFWLFNRLTPNVDTYQEILDNNLAVAALMALFIVGICLLMSAGVSGLVRALIPFPEIGSIPLK
jgi:putative membrane protein